MFFPDPVGAFEILRMAAKPGASLTFSCFRAWELNPWASEVANAAAGRRLPAPGREAGAFAFAERDHVFDVLRSSGWTGAEAEPVAFRYVAGEGGQPLEDALSFLAELGPASRVLQSLPEEDRAGALERMRRVIERHRDGDAAVFPAAAWIYRATAP